MKQKTPVVITVDPLNLKTVRERIFYIMKTGGQENYDVKEIETLMLEKKLDPKYQRDSLSKIAYSSPQYFIKKKRPDAKGYLYTYNEDYVKFMQEPEPKTIEESEEMDESEEIEENQLVILNSKNLEKPIHKSIYVMLKNKNIPLTAKKIMELIEKELGFKYNFKSIAVSLAASNFLIKIKHNDAETEYKAKKNMFRIIHEEKSNSKPDLQSEEVIEIPRTPEKSAVKLSSGFYQILNNGIVTRTTAGLFIINGFTFIKRGSSYFFVCENYSTLGCQSKLKTKGLELYFKPHEGKKTDCECSSLLDELIRPDAESQESEEIMESQEITEKILEAPPKIKEDDIIVDANSLSSLEDKLFYIMLIHENVPKTSQFLSDQLILRFDEHPNKRSISTMIGRHKGFIRAVHNPKENQYVISENIKLKQNIIIKSKLNSLLDKIIYVLDLKKNSPTSFEDIAKLIKEELKETVSEIDLKNVIEESMNDNSFLLDKNSDIKKFSFNMNKYHVVNLNPLKSQTVSDRELPEIEDMTFDFKIDDIVYAPFKSVLYGAVVKNVDPKKGYFLHYFGFSSSDSWVSTEKVKPVKDPEEFTKQRKKSKHRPIVRVVGYDKYLAKTDSIVIKEDGIELIDVVPCNVPYSYHVNSFDEYLIIVNKEGEIKLFSPMMNQYTLDTVVDTKFFEINSEGIVYTIDVNLGILQTSIIDFDSKKLINKKNVSEEFDYENTKHLLTDGSDIYTIEFEALYKITFDNGVPVYQTISDISNQWDTIKYATCRDSWMFLIDEEGSLFSFDLKDDEVYYTLPGNEIGNQGAYKNIIGMQFFEKVLYGIDKVGNLYAIHPISGYSTKIAGYEKKLECFHIDQSGHIWIIDENEEIIHEEVNKKKMNEFLTKYETTTGRVSGKTIPGKSTNKSQIKLKKETSTPKNTATKPITPNSKKRKVSNEITDDKVSTPKKFKGWSANYLNLDDHPDFLQQILEIDWEQKKCRERKVTINYEAPDVVKKKFPLFFDDERPLVRKLLKVTQRICHSTRQLPIKHLIFRGAEYNIASYCHHCGDCGALFVCEERKCRKVICLKCASKIHTDEEIEEILYTDKEWYCTHCRKTCPSYASCERNKAIALANVGIVSGKRKRKKAKKIGDQSSDSSSDDSDLSDLDEYDFPFEEDEAARQDKLRLRKERAMALAHFIVNLVPLALSATSYYDPEGKIMKELEPDAYDASTYDTWGHKTEKYLPRPSDDSD
eukprot:gene12542-6363_t